MEGALGTLQLGVAALLTAPLVGVVVLAIQLVPSRPVRIAAEWYVDLMRAFPLLVFLVIAYYLLLPLLGLRVDPFVAATVAFALKHGVYFAEIYRGGWLSVDRGQFLAAQSIGLTRWRMLRYVIAPQMLLIILPALTSQATLVVRDLRRIPRRPRCLPGRKGAGRRRLHRAVGRRDLGAGQPDLRRRSRARPGRDGPDLPACGGRQPARRNPGQAIPDRGAARRRLPGGASGASPRRAGLSRLPPVASRLVGRRSRGEACALRWPKARRGSRAAAQTLAQHDAARRDDGQRRGYRSPLAGNAFASRRPRPWPGGSASIPPRSRAPSRRGTRMRPGATIRISRRAAMPISGTSGRPAMGRTPASRRWQARPSSQSDCVPATSAHSPASAWTQRPACSAPTLRPFSACTRSATTWPALWREPIRAPASRSALRSSLG